MSETNGTTNGQPYVRPHRSDTSGKIAEALAKAQKVLKHPVKNSDNPFFKSTYADINEVFEAGRILADFGLAVSQIPTTDEHGRMELITEVLHVSGEWLRSYWPIRPLKPDPQTLAATVTYARRLAYQAIVGIAPQDGADDDGNRAAGHDTAPGRDSAARQPFPPKGNGTPPQRAVPAPTAAIVPQVMASIPEPQKDERPEDWGLTKDWGAVVFDVPESMYFGRTLREINTADKRVIPRFANNRRYGDRLPKPIHTAVLNFTHQLDRERQRAEAEQVPADDDGPASDMHFELEES